MEIEEKRKERSRKEKEKEEIEKKKEGKEGKEGKEKKKKKEERRKKKERKKNEGKEKKKEERRKTDLPEILLPSRMSSTAERIKQLVNDRQRALQSGDTDRLRQCDSQISLAGFQVPIFKIKL